MYSTVNQLGLRSAVYYEELFDGNQICKNLIKNHEVKIYNLNLSLATVHQYCGQPIGCS